jgi:hypothetical protein
MAAQRALARLRIRQVIGYHVCLHVARFDGSRLKYGRRLPRPLPDAGDAGDVGDFLGSVYTYA